MSDFLDSLIQRCPHDKEHPYAMINRDLIRDKDLSPECRMLLIYLLSHKENWNLNPRQLLKHFEGHMGIKKIYKIIREAMEAGYILREDVKINNIRVNCKYFVSEIPKFKKCFRKSLFRNGEKGHIKNEHIADSQESTILEEPPPLTPTPITPLKEKKKEDWWGGYFSKVTSMKIFESAWEEYLEQPFGSVKHIKAWLIAVIQRKLAEGALEEELEQRITRHHHEATLNDNYGQGNTILANRDHLVIVRGQTEDHIPYNLSDEDWKKETEKYFK